MQDVYIVAARRTPIGRFNGALASVPAPEFGAIALRAVIDDARIDPAAIAEVFMGNVLTAGLGQNPARQAAIGAGIGVDVPATTINAVCGSGLKAIQLAAQAIRAGEGAVYAAGGQESMSRAPHAMSGLRRGVKTGDITARDTMLVDGLWDAFNDVHMGMTAEHLAARFGISRNELDAFAVESQRRAAAALVAGYFAREIVPLSVAERRNTRIVGADEQPQPETSLETLARLAPAFDPAGTVTAGNASSLNDGAAAVIVASGAAVARHAMRPRARIAAMALVGVEPMLMGLGPVAASSRALELAGWTVADLDLIEVNEAFAAVGVAVNREMGWDPARVNVNGGAIALGHPIGASGCRLVVSLLHEMERRQARRGLATLCIGGGMGIAICLERDGS